MAVNTTLAGYNVGSDVSFAITDNYGDVFSEDMLGHLTDFESQSDDALLKVTPISNGGVPVYQTIWNGSSGNMMFVRTGPSFQLLFIDLMAAYHRFGIIPQFSISAQVRNRDGTIDQYLYTGVQFSRPRFGNFRGTKEVDMRLEFHASLMTGTGSLAQFLSALGV